MKGQFDHDNGTLNIDEFTAGIMYSVSHYFMLGIFCFCIANVSRGCMFTLCERQVHMIRKRFFGAVLNQEAAWFDFNEVGAITQKMSS